MSVEARASYDMLDFESAPLEKIQAMSAHDLTAALAATMKQLAMLGTLAQDAQIHVAEAKKAVRFCDKTSPARARLECVFIDADSIQKQIRDRIRTVRELKSCLQTAIRGCTA